jgi:23S rRNA (uracil1939-C5)-methyltransferase
MARDLIELSKAYKIESVTPVDMFPWTNHVETVVLLSQRKADNHIEVDLDLDGLDVTSAESKATYNEIQQYVLKETGLMVSNLYIAQIKKKCGIDVGECFNKPKTENAKQPKCPEDKEKAIKDALKHFGMI